MFLLLGLGKRNQLINALQYKFPQSNIDLENSDIDSCNHVVLQVQNKSRFYFRFLSSSAPYTQR